MHEEEAARLETQIKALAARVAALEANAAREERPSSSDVQPGEIDFRLMQRLQSRQGDIFDGDGVGGAIVYAGDFRNAHAKRAWHVERAVPYLASYDTETLAALLAALGNPQRIALVQQLLRGPQDRQQLQDTLHITSPGQLYHHLHSLLDTGVIRQQRRGVYALTAKATIPLLVILAAALDIMEDQENSDDKEQES